jgi:hypothetical protein
MADRILPYDEMVPADTTFEVDSTQAIRITALGTDASGTVTPEVDGNDLGPINSTVGALHPSATDEQGLLTLATPPGAEEDPEIEDSPAHGGYGPGLYYYIPPDGRINLDGSSSDTVRLQGHRLDGISERFEAGSDETRYDEQGSYHYTFEEGSVDVNEPISDEQQATVHTVSPATDERIELVGPQGISQSSGGDLSFDEGEVSVFYELDGQRLPGQFNDDTALLLDFTVMPRPATDSTDQVPFVYGKYGPTAKPLTVMGDQELDVNIRNTSGGSLDSSSSDTSTITYTAEVVFDDRR